MARSILRLGDRGDDVSELQERLNANRGRRGLPPIDVDGRYGADTRSAVREFQTSRGFEPEDVDGVAGPQTKGALGSVGWLEWLGLVSPKYENAPPEDQENGTETESQKEEAKTEEQGKDAAPEDPEREAGGGDVGDSVAHRIWRLAQGVIGTAEDEEGEEDPVQESQPEQKPTPKPPDDKKKSTGRHRATKDIKDDPDAKKVEGLSGPSGDVTKGPERKEPVVPVTSKRTGIQLKVDVDWDVDFYWEMRVHGRVISSPGPDPQKKQSVIVADVENRLGKGVLLVWPGQHRSIELAGHTVVAYHFELRCPQSEQPLEDVSSPLGAAIRLTNLGYFCINDAYSVEEHIVRDAIRVFQDDNGLPINGEMDETTQKELVAHYGR